MATSISWFPATAAHCRRAESASAGSMLGADFGPREPGDRVRVVVRGDAGLGLDLSAGRPEGAVPIDDVAAWIAAFLRFDRQRLVTMEDVVHRLDDPAVSRRERPAWGLPDGVAWPIRPGDSPEAIRQSLAMFRGGPALLGFHRPSTSGTPPDDGAVLSSADLDALRDGLVATMTDVFDWDGWIVWKRDRADPSLPGPELGPSADAPTSGGRCKINGRSYRWEFGWNAANAGTLAIRATESRLHLRAEVRVLRLAGRRRSEADPDRFEVFPVDRCIIDDVAVLEAGDGLFPEPVRPPSRFAPRPKVGWIDPPEINDRVVDRLLQWSASRRFRRRLDRTAPTLSPGPPLPPVGEGLPEPPTPTAAPPGPSR